MNWIQYCSDATAENAACETTSQSVGPNLLPGSRIRNVHVHIGKHRKVKEPYIAKRLFSFDDNLSTDKKPLRGRMFGGYII